MPNGDIISVFGNISFVVLEIAAIPCVSHGDCPKAISPVEYYLCINLICVFIRSTEYI
jgi:hypothetical protein